MGRSIILAVMLAGCASQPERVYVTQTETVEVPIPYRERAPDWLLEPIAVTPPEFVPVTDPDAVVGLSREGVDALKSLLLRVKSRLDQLIEYGSIGE